MSKSSPSLWVSTWLYDLSALLELRDEDSFSSRWMEEYKSIEAEKTGTEPDQLVTKIRQSAYLQTFDRWKSPDLAAYVSDDFGLIGDAIAVGAARPRISGLLRCYLDGRIPVGDLAECSNKLTELVAMP